MSIGQVMVTGAGGFTGGHACRLLARKGWEVTAIGSPRSESGFAGGVVPAERCDLTDGAAVRRLIRKYRPDALLHLAGQNAVDVSWREPAATLSANLMSTVFLLEGLRVEHMACQVVVAGSMLRSLSGKLTDAPNPYGFSKTVQTAAAAAWHRWYGMHVIVAEPSNLIGPGGSTGLCGKIARWTAAAEAALDVGPFVLSSLKETRDFLDVRDAVAAYELLLREGEPGALYALESGATRALEEVKQAFDEEANVPLRWQIHDLDSISPKPRDTAAIRGLGWQPLIPFRQSVRDALEDERRRCATKKPVE